MTSQTTPPATSQPSEAGVWLDRVLGAAAAILLFCLMALTTADVIGRYIFNWPLRGAFELTELLLLTLIFAGLPLASRADEHVTLDFIDMVLSDEGRLLLRRLVDLGGLFGSPRLDQGRQDRRLRTHRGLAGQSAHCLSWPSWWRSPASCI
jgi:hypothetical protein